MNSYEPRLLQSAMNSTYVCVCVCVCVCVHKALRRSILAQAVWSVMPFAGNNLRWKKELLHVMPLKMDISVTIKRDSEKLLQKMCTLIIDFTFLY
jgi:hypothetical protein